MALSFKALKAKNDSLRDAKEKLIDQLRTEQLAKEEELGRNLLLEEQVSTIYLLISCISPRHLIGFSPGARGFSDAEEVDTPWARDREHSSEALFGGGPTGWRQKSFTREGSRVDASTGRIRCEVTTSARRFAKDDYHNWREKQTACCAQKWLGGETWWRFLRFRNSLILSLILHLFALAKISAQLNEVQREKDQELKLSASLVRKNEQLELQLSQFSGERSAMLAQLERMRKDQQDQLLQQQRALSSVGGATQQYHNQIKQTQELLKVISID